MAPELIFAQINDDGTIAPPISTCSDVYAFASVCLEIASGQLPYPTRFNDHSVTYAIIQGARPTRTTACLLKLGVAGQEAFWSMLEECWRELPLERPTMPQMHSFLELLVASSTDGVIAGL